MLRVRIIKDYKEYKSGTVVEVSPNVAFGLIDAGYGVISKDMIVNTDYASKTLRRAKKGY